MFNKRPKTTEERLARVKNIIRRKINKEDLKILQALENRMRLVLNILKIKIKNGDFIVDLKRENEILEKIAQLSSLELKKYNLLFFSNIIIASKILQFESYYGSLNFSKLNISNHRKNVDCFKLAYFNVEECVIKNIKFSRCLFFRVKSLKNAILNLKSCKYDFLIIKFKGRNSFIKLATKHKIFALKIFSYNNSKYLIMANRPFYRKGKNFMFFSFEINNFENDFIKYVNILILNSVNVLSLDVRLNGKFFLIYAKVVFEFERKLDFFIFFDILSKNLKKFNIFALLKISKKAVDQ